jgi:hypothetical protein
MKKLTKLQKKWLSSFEHPKVGSVSLHLLIFLFKLKAINNKTYVECKDDLIDHIRMWSSLNAKYKLEKQFKQQDFSKPPKSIKPTRTRS